MSRRRCRRCYWCWCHAADIQQQQQALARASELWADCCCLSLAAARCCLLLQPASSTSSYQQRPRQQQRHAECVCVRLSRQPQHLGCCCCCCTEMASWVKATGLVNATTFSACFSLSGCVCVCGQTTPLSLSGCGRQLFGSCCVACGCCCRLECNDEHI